MRMNNCLEMKQVPPNGRLHLSERGWLHFGERHGPVAGGRQIVVERLGGHAQRAVGDDGFGAEFGGALPQLAAFGVAAEVEKQVAEAGRSLAVKGSSIKGSCQ
jgi:hypothetical protein